MNDNKKFRNRGISLISLIITIIVIIILAAIVIFTGLNTPDRANFAKFVSEFSNFRTAITQDFMNKKAQYAIEGKSRSDEQIYYAIAKSGDYSGDINQSPRVDGQVASLGVKILPEDLTGTDYYEIEDDTYVAEWKNNKAYYEARGVSGERHFLTDKGEPFILPGYRVEEDGTTRWYVNERKYYISEEPIRVNQGFSLEPGLYDINMNEQKYSWQELIENHYITVSDDDKKITSTNTSVLEGVLVIDDSVTGVKWSGLGGCQKLTMIVFPSTLTTITDGACGSCSNLEKVVFTEGFESLGGAGFTSCAKLKEISLPNSFHGGGGIFASCIEMKKATLGNEITGIPSFFFAGCNSLKEVYMSNSVVSIGEFAFVSCDSLTDVYFDGTMSEWKSITIGENNDSLNSATIHCMRDNSVIIGSINTGRTSITTDRLGNDVAGNNLDRNVVNKLYIQMSPTVVGGSVVIKEKSSGNIVTMPYEVTKNGDYVFVLSSTVDGVEEQEVNISVTNWLNTLAEKISNKELVVGDYIYYDPDTSNTYTTTVAQAGYANSLSLSTSTNKVWRVWDISGEKITIVSNYSYTNTELQLTDVQGYVNGAKIVNDACKALFTNSMLGVTGSDIRSMTIEDINAVYDSTGGVPMENNLKYLFYLETSAMPSVEKASAGYTAKEHAKASANSNIGCRKFFFPKDINGNTISSFADMEGGTSGTTDGMSYLEISAGNPVYVKTTSKVTDSPSWKTIGGIGRNSTANYGSMLPGGNECWLASPCVSLLSGNYNEANFGLQSFSTYRVTCFYGYASNGLVDSRGKWLCPLVSLSSTLQVVSGAGTSSSPYKLSR